MTWTEISKEKEDWTDKGKSELGWLINGWLFDYESLFGEISKLTSNWDEI